MSAAFDFTGRTVIVTGGARGIGLALSRFFAASGARLAIVDVDESALAETTHELQGALPLAVDVADAGQVDKAVAHVVEATGRLDVVVNNAGILRDRVVWKLSDDDWSARLGGSLPSHRPRGGRRRRQRIMRRVAHEWRGNFLLSTALSAVGLRHPLVAGSNRAGGAHLRFGRFVASGGVRAVGYRADDSTCGPIGNRPRVMDGLLVVRWWPATACRRASVREFGRRNAMQHLLVAGGRGQIEALVEEAPSCEEEPTKSQAMRNTAARSSAAAPSAPPSISSMSGRSWGRRAGPGWAS